MKVRRRFLLSLALAVLVVALLAILIAPATASAAPAVTSGCTRALYSDAHVYYYPPANWVTKTVPAGVTAGAGVTVKEASGGQVTLCFTGTGIYVFGWRNAGFGKANVYLDGVKRPTQWDWSATTPAVSKVGQITGMTYAQHVLVIQAADPTLKINFYCADLTNDFGTPNALQFLPTPSNVTATGGVRDVDFSWTAIPSTTIYTVQESTASYVRQVEGGATYTYPYLADKTSYTFYVRGKWGGQVGPKATCTATTFGMTATEPSAASTKAIGATVPVQWTTNKALKGGEFRIAVFLSTGGAAVYRVDTTFKPLSPVTHTSWTYSLVLPASLVPGTMYRVGVYYREGTWNPTTLTYDNPGPWVAGSISPGTVKVVDAASVTGVSPAFGSVWGGETVTLTGNYFTGASGVKFGDTPATNVVVVSNTSITCTAPAHAAGLVDVTVTRFGGPSPTAGTGNDYSYLNHYEEDSPPIVYLGSWQAYASPSSSAGAYKRATGTSISVTLPFNGSRLDWIATRGASLGKADVYVDSVLKATVDLYNASPQYKQRVWSTGDLTSGYHRVTIKWWSSNIAGRYIDVDAVEVRGTLLPLLLAQETEPKLHYDPAWSNATSSNASGGGYRYTNASGGKVTINFNGIGIALLVRTGSDYGKATVSVDGGAPGTVDLYSAQVGYVTIWSKWLAPGDHTVVFTRAGSKNGSSSGYTISLDAVQVWGVLK